jgi:hypothetical protein
MVVYTKAAYTNKPAGHNMLTKASQKLDTLHSYGLVMCPIPIILSNECNIGLINVQDACVTDYHPVGILPQIADHMFCTGHGRFTKYHPGGVVCILNVEIKGIGKTCFSKFPFQAVKEFSLKGRTKLMNRIEVFPVSNMLPFTFETVSCSRNNAMDMRMQGKVLPPRVEYGYCTGFHTIPGIPETVQGTPNGIEEQFIIHPGIPQAYIVQAMRNSEYNVVMLYRKGYLH